MRAMIPGLLLVSMSMLAGAADDPMSGFYGNTWAYQSKPENTPTPIYVNHDGTFSMVLKEDRVIEGKWSIDQGRVCFVAEHEVCFTDIAGRKVGESWTGTTDEGKYFSVIRSGRSAPARPKD